MNQVIFKNSKLLSKRDILLTIPIGLGILTLAELFSYLRGKENDLSLQGSLIFGCILFIIWTFRALNESTVKSIEIVGSKVFFTIQSQLNKDKIIGFEKDSLSITIITKSDRFLPRNKIMKVTSGEDELEISSRQKGLSEAILLNIQKELKHSSQQRV